MRKILLNYIYYSPVGHTVEALRYARGLYTANPDREIHVALSDRSAPTLLQDCPWITQTYPIHLDDFADSHVAADMLSSMPREWDYIIENNLILEELSNSPALQRGEDATPVMLGREETAMQRYYQWAAMTLTATSGRGTLFPTMQLPRGLCYQPRTRVTLDVPDANRSFVQRYAHDGPQIVIMLGGSGGYRGYPDVASWIMIIAALSHALPAARFYITGARPSASGHTYTAGYPNDAISEIMLSNPHIIDAYDIGLWNQIALIERSAVFLSPHTGFAFLPPCVGTPWLAISGGNWPEYFFNDVPFYSVLPDNPAYPYQGALDIEGDGPKIPCMQPDKLAVKIPEIVEAMQLLLSPDFTFTHAVARHLANIRRANIRRERIPTTSSW